MSISARQSRAARELLGWTQPQLAEAAILHLSLVKNFECEYRVATAATLAAILRAFENAGVVFENGGRFLGVKAKGRRGMGSGSLVDGRRSRAARELLGWTQEQLAESASLRLGTIRSFEGEQRELAEAKLLAISCAFKKAAIVFENDRELVGLRLRVRKRIK
jgi:transcriptional regulator with XRE-family HTH domain